mgnify:CR=1 FL=1
MKKLLLGVMCCLVMSTAVIANEASVAKGLAKVIPTVSKDDVSATPIAGLYQVFVAGRLLYASEDGRYIIRGDMIDLTTRNNLTESLLKTKRTALLKTIDEKDMIIFPAKNAQHTLTVFSDIDCGYCRKMHSQLSGYTDAGISVRYLFFPRSGPNTESYFKAVSVWCAADRNKALTDAKLNNKIDNKSCGNPVDAHMNLARMFGVTGTPSMITEDGSMIPGFLPADQLVKRMNW